MREILADRLWIGNAIEARDYRRLHELEIRAVVDVALEEQPGVPPREFIYLRYPLLDGIGNSPTTLTMAIRSIADLLRSDTRTMVACSAGMSRSPSLAAAALAIVEQVDVNQKLNELAAAGSLDASPAFLQEVVAILPRLK